MRLIAFDLDGTLLDHDKTVPRRSADVISKLKEHGCKIAVITGRARVPEDVLEGIQPDAIATSNGGVVQVGETEIARHALTPEQVRSVNAALPPEARLWAYSDDTIFVRDTDGIQPAWLQGRAMKHIDEVGTTPISQMSFTLEKARRFEDAILAVGGVNLTGGLAPYESFITVTPDGADKGTALAEIAAHFGVDMAHTVVFGDSDNDLAMFKVASVAVQVGSHECLADHATHRVSCSALGLPGWLESYVDDLSRELADAAAD
ncbi:HAD family hydrolase [Deinococcus yavapaiensis]|uniref:HMP-PP phosphatase n=1 Tax=Deinococcus yavapaiensis KR-236 TaxID=694435 RepID=A0A318SAH7_9DEIO|nr:HAD family hydrolase [Deinococcus yavapaiensis]PYE56359.1 HMP-PP phosphatase [Deinococcus yavapaiensis KR-236]